MVWLIYNILFSVCYVLMMPRFLCRMCRRGGYARNFWQRLGVYSADTVRRLGERRRIWIHAVSVGEVYVALRFIAELRRDRPDRAFVLTTTTSTGYGVAQSGLDGRDMLLYFPLDFPFIARRVLGMVRPESLILVESELWPNLVRIAAGMGTPVILVNGRISESSYSGYRLARFFFGKIARSLALALVQTENDAVRLKALGCPPETVRVMGSAKYDVALNATGGAGPAGAVLAAAGIDPSANIIVGGSTWPGEERILLDACRNLKRSYPSLKLVLVPRHAERRDAVEKEIRRSGLDHVRRSDLDNAAPAEHSPDVLLVDSTGELPVFYECATVVFVGKSLTAHGGQNMIEPACMGKPVLVGPYLENFPVVSAEFLAHKAMIQVRDARELEDNLRLLLSDAGLREEYGRRAREVVGRGAGATRKSAELVGQVIGDPTCPD